MEVALERPSDPEHGDYATTVALRLAPLLGRPPRQIAEEVAERVVLGDLVERIDIAGPGFLNLTVSQAWYGQALAEMLAASDYGAGSASPPERIQVELVSANPTGPLTVGSARNGAYGDSVARLLAFASHTVEEEYYFNDAGGQMERFRQSVAARRRGEEPPEDGYHGAYIDQLAHEDGDPVPRMLRQIEATLLRFRIGIDSWQRQTVIESEIPAAIAELDTYEADGAVWARTSEYGDEKDRVLIRSNGEPTYFAADAAYIRHKLARFERAIYVLGADHHGYVARLKALAAMLGSGSRPDRGAHLPARAPDRAGRGAGRCRSGGETSCSWTSFSTRSASTRRAGTSSAEVTTRPSRSTSTSPASEARRTLSTTSSTPTRGSPGSCATLRGRTPATLAHVPVRGERELLKRIAEFPALVAEATERRAPHAIPIYAVRLADDFHRFYHDCRVLGSDEEPFRLGLCRATQAVIARCLDLVGVDAPERM